MIYRKLVLNLVLFVSLLLLYKKNIMHLNVSDSIMAQNNQASTTNSESKAMIVPIEVTFVGLTLEFKSMFRSVIYLAV